MSKPEFGTKHVCEACAERFYDLNRSPVICFKCGAPAVAAEAADVSANARWIGQRRLQPASASDPVEEKVEPADESGRGRCRGGRDLVDEDTDLDDEAEVEIEVEIDPEDGKILA
jgi:uncharacterized protein (TIGR02300 family)